MFKDKKNIIITLLLFIVVLLLIIIFIYFIGNKTKKIDASNYTSDELLKMFEDNGYQIELKQYSDLTSSFFIIFNNDSEGITIQRIYNIYVGTQMTFCDKSINDDMADLLYLDKNDTLEEKQQYKAFQSWLDYFNITKTQLSDFLDQYYKNNSDKITTEIISSDIY